MVSLSDKGYGAAKRFHRVFTVCFGAFFVVLGLFELALTHILFIPNALNDLMEHIVK